MTASEHTELLRDALRFVTDIDNSNPLARRLRSALATDGAEPVPVAWRFEKALIAIVQAWHNATTGKPNAERDLGWTGSTDNWGQIFAWYAEKALLASPTGMGVTEAQVDRVVSVVEERIYVIWARPGARAEFAAEIAAALHPTEARHG